MATPAVPPVVDHVQRTKIHEAVQSSPFNIFNIIAIVVIVILGFYLYKRFTAKKPRFNFPAAPPAPQMKTAPAPIIEEEEEETPAEPATEPSKED
jgi:hypothetical protein